MPAFGETRKVRLLKPLSYSNRNIGNREYDIGDIVEAKWLGDYHNIWRVIDGMRGLGFENEEGISWEFVE